MTLLDKLLCAALLVSLATNLVQSAVSRYAWAKQEIIINRYYRDRKKYPEL